MNKCVCIKELKTFDGHAYEKGKLYTYTNTYTNISEVYIVAVNREKEYGFIPDSYPIDIKEKYGDCIFSDYFRFIDYYRDSVIDNLLI